MLMVSHTNVQQTNHSSTDLGCPIFGIDTGIGMDF
tara:strand:+ start:397 stop:501 length:105 start_codon:yes stop_codon:yes gene_type:complete